MIEAKYLIPKVGAGTDVDPWRPDVELTQPGESLRVEGERGSDLVCWARTVARLPFPVVR